MSEEARSPATSDRIVVGIDGSRCSKATLAWAARQSKLMSVPLVVVTAWMYPTSSGWNLWPNDFNPEADAKAVLQETIDAVVGSDAGIELSTAVVEGPPALVLLEYTGSALMIVVGSRGHGEFAGMLLGSVSQFLTTHAHCPVVVVR